ncbi:MAG: hypothetical protein NWP84_01545, partial [Cyanobium sp. MAG_04]|nr:hypothetical protein [Cyanobium sp. MAG_04]
RHLQAFWQGSGPSGLAKLGDCFAAALAVRDHLPLGYIGDDFISRLTSGMITMNAASEPSGQL